MDSLCCLQVCSACVTYLIRLFSPFKFCVCQIKAKVYITSFVFDIKSLNLTAFYVYFRFFTGFFLSGILIVGFVLTSELVGPSKRNIVGTVPAGVFALGVALMSLTAWYTQHWRIMSLLLGGVGLALTPVLY